MPKIGAKVLEEKHLISILLFLKENGRCNKMTVYNNISSNPRMPDKLNTLEDSGLLTQTQDEGSHTVWLTLTSKGEKVSEQLQMIDSII